MSKKEPRYTAPPAVRQRAKELRWPMTPAEQILWDHLKGKQLSGLKFRRQHPLHHFILDFYCHQHKFVVEVDGQIHRHQAVYDKSRTEWLEKRGFRVMHFTNQEVMDDIEDVLQKILEAIQADDS